MGELGAARQCSAVQCCTMPFSLAAGTCWLDRSTEPLTSYNPSLPACPPACLPAG